MCYCFVLFFPSGAWRAGLEPEMEATVEDYRLHWPFRMLVAGSSSSGKMTLVHRLIANTYEAMDKTPRVILLFYAHMQEAYERIKDSAPCPVVFIKGGPPDDLKTKPHTLMIVDDLQSSHSGEMLSWFTKKSHHMNISGWYTWYRMYLIARPRMARLVWTPLTILFKNPRDSSQVTHLDKQVFPGAGGFLTEAYRAVTTGKPHTYIVIDFN